MERQDVVDPNQFAQQLFTNLPDRYDRLAEWLSFGQNVRWRTAMVDALMPAHPSLVLDVASGTAGVALQIAARTGARVVGVDVTEAMLRRGKANIDRVGRHNLISLALGRAEQLPFADEAVDALTFTYLLRYVDDPQATLTELARVVRPGGVVANLEFLVPPNRFWRFWWWLYTRLALPAAGYLTGGKEWFDVGAFLGPSISGHYEKYPVAETVKMWQRAGITDVHVRVMSLGGGLVMWGRREGGGRTGE